VPTCHRAWAACDPRNLPSKPRQRLAYQAQELLGRPRLELSAPQFNAWRTRLRENSAVSNMGGNVRVFPRAFRDFALLPRLFLLGVRSRPRPMICSALIYALHLNQNATDFRRTTSKPGIIGGSGTQRMLVPSCPGHPRNKRLRRDKKGTPPSKLRRQFPSGTPSVKTASQRR